MIRFPLSTKIFHSAPISRTKSLFSIQPLLPTMLQVTIQAYVACTNNVYDQLQAGDGVHHVMTAFSLKRIQNWIECEACMSHKFSYSYPLPPIASPTPVLLFSGLSSLAMPHVVTQGCGWSSPKWRMTALKLHQLFTLIPSYEEPI